MGTGGELAWYSFMPLLAAGIAATTAFAILWTTQWLTARRQLATCAASLCAEIDVIVRAIKKAEDAAKGKNYVSAEFLKSPDRLIWSYKGLSQYIGLMESETSKAVVEFYCSLSVVTPVPSKEADSEFCYLKTQLDHLCDSGATAKAALRSASSKTLKARRNEPVVN